MQVHHIGELFILVVYMLRPEIGREYMLGGAMMQLSSCFLHIGKIIHTISVSGQKVPSWIRTLTTALLTLTWVHSRLYVFPLAMYAVWLREPLFTLHAFLLVVGCALTAANVVWLWKIVRKTVH